MATTAIHRRLRAAARGRVRAEGARAGVEQGTAISSKHRRTADARPTGQRTGLDGAEPLGRLQREAAAAGGRGEGRARAGRVPGAGGDDAAVLAAAGHDVEVAGAGEGAGAAGRGRLGGGGRRTAGGGRRSGGAAGAGALRWVLDARAGTLGGCADDVRGDKITGLDGALHVEEVPDLAQHAAGAAEVDLVATAVFAQGGLDLSGGVGRCVGGDNSGVREPLVGGQGLEEADDSVEEVRHFFRGLVVGIAVRVERADASSVLGPLVFPEGLGAAAVADPVLIHVVEEVGLAEGL